MRKKISGIICFLLIMIGLVARYASEAAVSRTGVKLLLPVSVENVTKDAFSSVAKIRYENFVPVEELKGEKGVLIVQRFDDGRVMFVSDFTGQKLQPAEVLLKYSIRQPFFPIGNKTHPNIRFAASDLRFFPDKNFHASAVRYAVVYVSADGRTSLRGLTDNAGLLLVTGIDYAMPDTL